METLKAGKLTITAWDVGGCDKIRPLWRHYMQAGGRGRWRHGERGERGGAVTQCKPTACAHRPRHPAQARDA